MKDKNEFLRGKPTDASGEQLLSFVFKVVTLLIIFIGIQVGAQKFARSVEYDPGWAGNPAFSFQFLGKERRIYSFWKMFTWPLMYYKRTAIHPYLWGAWRITLYTSVAAIVFYFFLEFILIRNRNQNIFGTARWANKKDLVKAGLLQYKGGVILGQLASARLECAYNGEKQSVIMSLRQAAQKIIQSEIYNTLLSAPTRSGKGVSCVIPTLLGYPGSVIVLDFKGENFNITSGFRKKFGKVFRWEPTGEKGHHFNPLMEIRSGDNAFSDANLIADILTTPAEGGGNATSEHFRTAAKDFLTAVILHCLCSSWKDKSLPGCRAFLAQIDPGDPENTKYVYDLMIESEHCDPAIHQSIVEGAGAQRKRPNDEGGSLLSTVNNALAVYADANVRRNIQESEFYIDEFVETTVPISLYLTIQYSDVARIAPLIRLFVTFFSRRFTSGETQATKRKLEVPLLFILDEFDKLGRMDELEMNMGIHNGFGIHYFLIFQSLNQLTKIYTKDHSFLAHCRNSIFYAPGAGELDSAEMISKICGRESINKASISYSGNRGALGFNGSNLSSQDQERNLINADEIIKLPLDRFLLICQGMPPYIGKKNVYYQDPVFKARLCDPAFTTREEAAAMAAGTVKRLAARRWFDFTPREGDGERAAEITDSEVTNIWEKLSGVLDEEPSPPAASGAAAVPESAAAETAAEENDDSAGAYEEAAEENFL